MRIYKTQSQPSKIGNYMAHVGHPGVLGLGPESIIVGYEQKQIGLTEPEDGEEPQPIYADDLDRPIRELTGYWLYDIAGDEVPSEQQVEIDYEEPGPEESAPVSDVERLRQGVANYAAANEAAQQIIYELMVKVAGALIAFKLFAAENVNDEGARFVAFHWKPILDYKTAGRNAKAALALYEAVASGPSKAAFPWLNNEVILGLFSAALVA